MCLKIATIVTRIPAQQAIKFNHVDYFNMSKYEQAAHFEQCKQFAHDFNSGLYPITDFFSSVFESPYVQLVIANYANNTFDNEDIIEYIASDIDYFVMLNNLDNAATAVQNRLHKQWKNKVDFSRKMRTSVAA